MKYLLAHRHCCLDSVLLSQWFLLLPSFSFLFVQSSYWCALIYLFWGHHSRWTWICLLASRGSINCRGTSRDPQEVYIQLFQFIMLTTICPLLFRQHHLLDQNIKSLFGTLCILDRCIRDRTCLLPCQALFEYIHDI